MNSCSQWPQKKYYPGDNRVDWRLFFLYGLLTNETVRAQNSIVNTSVYIVLTSCANALNRGSWLDKIYYLRSVHRGLWYLRYRVLFYPNHRTICAQTILCYLLSAGFTTLHKTLWPTLIMISSEVSEKCFFYFFISDFAFFAIKLWHTIMSIRTWRA